MGLVVEGCGLAGRSMQALVIHSERGEVGRHRVNI
jgi:hypothetical protein